VQDIPVPQQPMTSELRACISLVCFSSREFFCYINIHTDQLYSTAQRKKHAGHRGDDTYDNHYAPQNPGTDGQGSYFGDEPRKIVSDLFCAMTLSRNSELWQSLPAEKQNELENSPGFTRIEKELESLSLESKDDSETRDRRKEIYIQKRKLVSEELREF
jgi:Protein of unknown function (DUF3435)